ncbi:Zn(II)2Cys6 transcription factor [Aspergillus ambiguus]|uniref:Zn(II)2Cys6 transcription factor n=1 Tax=Aspergillus ambiguus TaxID=176160 RepID=UPI003CCDE9E3
MSGRNAPRSKNGCSTCRRRKVKCGEERPVCQRCFNLRLNCEWGVPVKRGKSAALVRPIQPAQPRWSTPSDLVSTATVTTTPTPGTAASPAVTFHSQLAAFPVDLWHPSPSSDLTPVSTEAVSPAGWSCFSHYLQPPSSPLYPSLSTSDTACANSLVLSEHDRKYFQFFPSSSLVFYYMKPWQWSSFCYLYQGPAASNKVIMRMILALSASDMHRQGLVVRSPGRPSAEDHARFHYGHAVKEFRQLLESPKRDISTTELEMIFATMFLMVTYEWQYGNCVHHLQLHLQGVRSLLESHPELFQIKDVNNVLLSMDAEQSDDSVPRVSFIPEQLLLWILYIDASCRPMGITESLYDYVLRTGNPALHPDRLHRCARLWSRCFWGKQYPDHQVSDDIENYRALELLHVGMTLRYRTFQLLTDESHADYEADTLFNELMSVHDRYSDLFLTAKFAGAASTRRTLNTINMAVSTFYAQLLCHRRLLLPHQLPATIHRHALTNIIEIVHKQYASDPHLLRRLHWPVVMALIETDDSVQREWLRLRLLELRDYHSECRWTNDIADQVLSRQDTSKGEYANLAELLRNSTQTK